MQHNLQSLFYCCCSVTDPGVPYTVTVRASTAVGIGEPVSLVVFSVQQGNIMQRPAHKRLFVMQIIKRATIQIFNDMIYICMYIVLCSSILLLLLIN